MVSNGSDGSQLSADAVSLRCDADICSASERTSHLQPLADGASIVHDEVQYDCAHATTRILNETAFAADGRRLRQVQGPSPWSPVQLDTIGFAAMRFACRARLAVAQGDPHAQTGAPGLAEQPQPSAEMAKANPSRHRSAGTAGGAAVQVTASATDASARSALDRIARTDPLAATLSRQVQPAVVQGRPVYRGVFTGFASVQAATAFCERLQRTGRACMLRKAPPSEPVAGGTGEHAR